VARAWWVGQHEAAAGSFEFEGPSDAGGLSQDTGSCILYPGSGQSHSGLSHLDPNMPPRAAKRKRASSPVDSPATSRRTRSNAKGDETEEQQEAPVLVAVQSEQPLPLLTALACQRKQGLLLDAEFEVGGTCIKAHKCILVALSPYLKGLFTSGLAEASSGGPVVIRDVDGAALAACVDCMYSGTIALTGATVCAVIKASNLLGLAAVEKAACTFFVERLEPETALDALGFAESMAVGGVHGGELYSQVLAYVHERFAECAAEPTFVRLAPSSVAALIRSDKLHVHSEEVVLSALRRWYEHDTEGRSGSLEELVPLVRLPLLPVEARLLLAAEPMLLLLSKPKLAQLLLECMTGFKDSTAAAGCWRLKPRLGVGRVFTFASIDNTNARGDTGYGRFDEAGVLHHIATEGGTSAYVNPHTAGRVVVSNSGLYNSGHGLGSLDRFVEGQYPSHHITDMNDDTWMAVDLGASRQLLVNHYALRHGAVGEEYLLRNWELQGSDDGASWTTLRRHDDDESIEATDFFVSHWTVEGVVTPYRHFRVHRHGPNADQATDAVDAVSCSGIELYGRLFEYLH
jgi:hypothetical protein